MEIANIHTMILMKQNDDNTDREISENESEDPGESTLSSDIKQDDFGQPAGGPISRPGALRYNNMNNKGSSTKGTEPCGHCHCHHFTCKSATFGWGHRTTIAQVAKSTIDILCESDVVPAQAIPLLKAGGAQRVPQPEASRDHNVYQHQMVTVEVAK